MKYYAAKIEFVNRELGVALVTLLFVLGVPVLIGYLGS